MAVLNLAAFAEERVGLVEEEDGAALLGRIEHPPQVLLGFTNVLADHLAEIDAVEVELQLVGQHLCRHGLAGAAGPGEQRSDPQPSARAPRKAPIAIDARALPHVGREVSQDAPLRFGQHQVVPPGRRHNALGQVLDPRPRLAAARLP